MMTNGNDNGEPQNEAGGAQPNVSPELQDAIRSIDAIGENAWGKDDDEDAPRSDSGRDADAQPETSAQDDADQT